MKKTLIIIILLILVAGAGIFAYTQIKKNKSSQTNTPDIKTVEYLKKQSDFNNAITAITVKDSDADGLSNIDEAKYGTDPNKADTDGDGLLDKDEIMIYHTNPLKADTDGDGFNDGYEVRHHTNPLDPKSHP